MAKVTVENLPNGKTKIYDNVESFTLVAEKDDGRKAVVLWMGREELYEIETRASTRIESLLDKEPMPTKEYVP